MEAAFGTLAYAERLKAAGIENAHADALRIAFSEGVAKKAHIREVRADITGLASRMDGLDKRMDGMEENMVTKTGIARLETQVQRSVNRAMFAVASLFVALAAVITAIGLSWSPSRPEPSASPRRHARPLPSFPRRSS